MKSSCKKATCAVVSVVTALTMTAGLASIAVADDNGGDAITYTAPTSPIELGNYVTGVAAAAAQATPDILGISNTARQASSAGTLETLDSVNTAAELSLFGTIANTNPNPYTYNYYYNLYVKSDAGVAAGAVASNDTMVWLNNKGPMNADTTLVEEYGNVSAGMYWRPNVLYGNGGSTTYEDVTYLDNQGLAELRGWGGYAQQILKIRTWTNDPAKVGTTNADGNTYVLSDYYKDGDENYNPVGLSIGMAGSLRSNAETFYKLAEVGDQVAAETGKSLRYGSAMTIAYNIEKYSLGSSWYVLSQLDAEDGTVDGNIDKANKKNVLIVNSVDTENASVTMVNMDEDGAETVTANLGNRIGTAIQDCVNDVYDMVPADKMTEIEITSGRSKTKAMSVAIADLADVDVDVILLTSGSASDVEKLYAAAGKDCPIVFDNQSPKLVFTTAGNSNSPECSLVAGMIIGFVYPEYLNEVDMVCYYFDKAYHLTTEGIAQSMAILMPKVSLSEGLEWTVDGYDAASVSAKLDEGTTWYYAHKDSVDSTRIGLKSTDWLDNAPTGWVKAEDGTWSYRTQGYVATTGWAKINNKWYYFDAEGTMQTGWQKIGTTWYYLKASGAMATGWQKISNSWYYLGTNGKMVTGWKKIDGTYYCFASSGKMYASKWIKSGTKWCYVKASGAMVSANWAQVDGKWYYFNASGYMVTGKVKIGNYYYTFASNGVWNGKKTAA